MRYSNNCLRVLGNPWGVSIDMKEMKEQAELFYFVPLHSLNPSKTCVLRRLCLSVYLE